MKLSSKLLQMVDFLIGLVIIACGIYALYLMVQNPYVNTSALRTTIYNFGLGGLAIALGIMQLIFAYRRARSNSSNK